MHIRVGPLTRKSRIFSINTDLSSANIIAGTRAGHGANSLRRRLSVTIGLLVLSSLFISIGAIFGIERLHSDLGIVARGHEELRQVYDAGLNLSLARENFRQGTPPDENMLRQLQLSQSKLALRLSGNTTDRPAVSPEWTNARDRPRCVEALTRAIRDVRLWIDDPSEAEKHDAAAQALDRAIDALEQASVNARLDIAARQAAAESLRHRTLIGIFGISLILVPAATLLGAWQYRAVMRPLDRLGADVRRFAGGQFDTRSDATGDREFVALAGDFNRMAAELDSFYRELQEKVAVQSRELARSQRLASVGFLAAGVSHEINNPLGIITGYAERTLRLLDEPTDDNQTSLWAQTRRAMLVICEEAFRCKSITSRLLAMAQPGGEPMTRVSLVAVARQVVSHLAGMPHYADRQLTLETPDGPSECFVEAREGELRQVLLNLAINGLTAVSPGDGCVWITIRSIGDCIELVVRDNGRGMNEKTLERIFEPFYSESPRDGRTPRGTGLGLSISLSIIVEHRGRMTAESNGINQGSRFVITLPAAGVAVALTGNHA